MRNIFWHHIPLEIIETKVLYFLPSTNIILSTTPMTFPNVYNILYWCDVFLGVGRVSLHNVGEGISGGNIVHFVAATSEYLPN